LAHPARWSWLAMIVEEVGAERAAGGLSVDTQNCHRGVTADAVATSLLDPVKRQTMS
jgi:hypothetical protein